MVRPHRNTSLRLYFLCETPRPDTWAGFLLFHWVGVVEQAASALNRSS